ncbi:hypothetical protein SS1G_05394 [Sclerotinia sclerotiorum 1980 UF-70]|uniref:Cytochrome P450 n=1 Tax=Sclerotinia sclerotiorum (strain ATCC 18683 / 1980 / Ss-1) TaxID=665079 RepID=A7EJA1_SCLS1|nr:hypothetical protein SS1G_05394 [Sclerotinia sclerotiorum 1980 UF-70]EDO02917.1 hypothetical protein SS1G_05394 [Sclerotinia sclerotiorum 1980 UF-70]
MSEYLLTTTLQTLYLHPLSPIPGPFLWKLTRIPYIHSLLSGTLVINTRKHHSHYGTIMRTAPNEASFATEQAWHEIFLNSNNSSQKALPRDPVIGPAFTDRAVARQEGIIQSYVTLMVEKLLGEIGRPGNRKMVMALAGVMQYFPSLESLILKLLPARIRKMQAGHFSNAAEKIHRRLQRPEAAVGDFMTVMLDQKNNPNFSKMSMPEIESSVALMLLGGSETTGTTICGTINCLIQNPVELTKLECEIRNCFDKEEDITFSALQQLPFLNAVINEGLRLCNPVSGGLLRIVPRGGAVVCGQFLPEGTHVAMNTIVMAHSEANFHRCLEFLPDRYLPDNLRPAEFKNDNRNILKPWGLGTRNCLGRSFGQAELRVVLARLVGILILRLLETSSSTGMILKIMLWCRKNLYGLQLSRG